MLRRRPAPYIVLWAAVVALLLNAAAPFLAVGAAHARGIGLADVCSVYGVRLSADSRVAGDVGDDDTAATPGRDGSGSLPGQSHPSAHASDHCALTALSAFAMPAATATGFAASGSVSAVVPSASPRDFGDATARWVTQLHHGPPTRA